MRFIMLLCAALMTSGCATQATSALRSGQSYQTGQERYDSFFGEVAALRDKTKDIAGEEPMRGSVSEALGLPADSKLADTIDAAKARSSDLKKDGGRFYVVVATEPKLIVKKGSGDEAKEAAAFAKAVDEAIKGGIARANELEQLAKDAQVLEGTVSALESEVDTLFAEDAAKRVQTRIELTASKEILERARLTAGNESGQALRFVVLLASAVDSGAAELLALEASTKEGQKPKAKPKWTGKGTGKPVKPKPKQDFDP